MRNHKQTTGEKAVAAGFPSLTVLAARWGVTKQTLRDWDEKHPERFQDLLTGARLRDLALVDKKRQIVTCVGMMDGSVKMMPEQP